MEEIDVLGEMKAFAREEVVWQNSTTDEFVATIRNTEVVRLDADDDTVLLMIDSTDMMVDMVPNDPKAYNTKAKDMVWQFHLRKMLQAHMQNRILTPGTMQPQAAPFQIGTTLPFSGDRRR